MIAPAARQALAGIARRVACRRGYCFFSGGIGVTGCDPPVDFGPGVTPALLSVEPFELLVAVVLVFGFAPLVGPPPASFAVAAPDVGPLPASAFGCANAGAERPTAITKTTKLPWNKDMRSLL
jgi:hypothetical protein